MKDLNGRESPAGRWWKRWAVGWRRRSTESSISFDDPEAVVIAESVDDAVASSTALAESSWRMEAEVIVRHVLILPAGRVTEAAGVAALDEYRVDTGPGDERFGASVPSWSSVVPTDGEVLVLARVQLLDAMHLSQERSRMASLGSRHGGTVVGWQVLQRPG